MTAERFMIDKRARLEYRYAIRDNFELLDQEEVCDLLNELHDEKQSVIDWIDNKIEEIKPYNSELCRATLLELKEFLE